MQVAGGTYRGAGNNNLQFKASGTSGTPITLQAASGTTVTVDGGELISGWSQVGTSSVYTYANWNHYFAPQGTGTGDARSEPRDQLFVDGQFMVEVTSQAAMTPGTFYVDPGGTHAIYAWLSDGSNPSRPHGGRHGHRRSRC